MLKQMKDLEAVFLANFDLDKLGMQTIDATGDTKAARKRTTVFTNSTNIAEMLRRAHRDGAHEHEPLRGWQAKACEVYPYKFVRLICNGIQKELEDARWRRRLVKQLDIGEPMGTVMSIQYSLEALIPPHEPSARTT